MNRILNRVKIGPKLITAFLLFGIVPLLVSGFILLDSSRSALEIESYNKLSSISEYKTLAVEGWVRDRMADVHAVPLTPFYVNAAKVLRNGSPQEKDQARREVLHEFKINRKLHAYFNEMKILDLQGNHLVSLKGLDVNESDKGWFKEALANAQKTVKGGKCQDLFVGTCEYCGELGLPSVHMSHIIRDRETFEPIAMFVVDANIDHLQKLMEQSVGLGETGQTYMVGPDGVLRSNTRLDSEPTIFKKKIDTEGFRHVFEKRQEKRGSGICENEIYMGYHGEPVLGHNHYLKELDLAVMTEINEAEAFAAINKMQILMLAIAGIGVIAIAIGGFLLARSVANPVVKMTSAMRELADGDKTIEIPAQDRGDEIGDMSGAVQVFKENMIKADELAAEQRKEEEARAERGRRIEQLCNDFDERASEAVKSVAAASTEMQASSESMAATAEETSTQSATVAAASEQASANVQTVASAAEELSSSISEISRQVGQSSEIASNAVRQAEETNEKVQGLAEAANKIGEVVALITDIADQTNLLALNATIEAARAGDAGKGFAVVASEVKNLANQTAKATDEIGTQISGIQTSTQEAVTAIEEIGKTISEVDEISTTIASAVEEQGAATQEIARNVEQAAAGTQEVSSNITGVNQAASDTGAAATQIQSAAGELSQQSEVLREEVDKFLVNVRAA